MLFFQVIVSRGGRFLEAPVSGNQQLSNDGMLVILAAGDRGLYEDCSSCFQAMGKTSFFLGNWNMKGLIAVSESVQGLAIPARSPRGICVICFLSPWAVWETGLLFWNLANFRASNLSFLFLNTGSLWRIHDAFFILNHTLLWSLPSFECLENG